MKFSKLSQLLLVSAIGLVVATLMTACQLVTIDYLFVATSGGTGSSGSGQIESFAVDSQSGALRQAGGFTASGGSNPVSMAVTSNYYSLYVANQGSNTVVHFGVADNGRLSNLDTITTATPPVAVAVSKNNKYLYVVSGSNSATLSEYPLDTNGKIGAMVTQVSLSLPAYSGDTVVPTGVTVLANNNDVYVSAYDRSAYNPGGATSSSANPGWVFGYGVGSGGALTPAPGSPYIAGVKPSALAADPTNRFVYVTDFASNQMIGYTIQSSGALNFMVNGPFKTGNEPTDIVVDPRGIYIYVSNELDSSVTGYTISLPTGTPSALVNSNASALYQTDTQPVAITLDPALGRFVYTANILGNSVSGFRLNPDTGVLVTTQATPYPTGVKPAALIAVPHGNHSTQAVAP